MKPNPIRMICGIIIFICIITATINMGPNALNSINLPRIMIKIIGENTLSFIDFRSLLLVLLAGGSLGLTSYKGGGFTEYIKSCKKHYISAGILGAVIGVTQMLQNQSDPDMLGAGMTIALLSIFYGIILYSIADAITT